MANDELETLLAQPYGLRRLLTRKIFLPAHADADHKRRVALELAMLISDHLIKNGGKIEDVSFAFERLMTERMEHRKEEDADIKEDNQMIAFTRQVLEAAVKQEQEGRPKRDKLTEEEIQATIKYGLEAKMESTMRNVEKQYWFRIGEQKAEGYTSMQARDKIYQDLLDNGDLEAAKAIRAYQDIVHPLKDSDQESPPSSS